MAAFVLVHGAGHGGWCWEKIVPLLARDGHAAAAPDLPACGKDQTPPSEATLEANVAVALRAAERAGEPAVLVGHSLGGVTITQAAERRPDLVRALVYVTALLPADGQTARDITASEPDAPIRRAYEAQPDGLTYAFARPAAPGLFYNECTFEDAYCAVERLRPQPAAIAATAVRTTPQRFGSVPRWYVMCLRDHAITPSMQRRMLAATPCRTVEIDTDHSPFFSAPEELAAHLGAVARELDDASAASPAARAEARSGDSRPASA